MRLPSPIARIFEKLRKKNTPRGWVLLPLGFAFACLATYTLSLATNYHAWRDFHLFAHMTPIIFLLNVLIVFVAFNLCHALTNRWLFSAAMIGYLSGMLVLMHIYKLKVLDVPLVPSDIYMASQFFTILPHLMSYLGTLLILMLLSLILALLFFIWIRRLRCLSGTRRYRWTSAFLSLGLLGALLACRLANVDESKIAGLVTWTDWNQKENYERNGFFFSTLANLDVLINPINEPKAYSSDAIGSIYQKYASLATPTAGTAANASGEPANVILILAEAFWDIDRLGITTTRDPIPFFHELQKTCRSGHIRVPTYGGYTAKTEFEVMTGCAMANLPEVSNPYQSYINLNRKLPTLPNIFKKHNYRTIAVHPYFKSFYDRSKAYPMIGFDQFIDIYGFKDKRKSGPFISDEVLADKLIEISNEVSPHFIFAISMATHGPYTYDHFLNESLDVTTPLLPESRSQVKNYINAISHTDAALKRLIDHFSKETRKTVIIVFGDHLPMLGYDMEVYREVNYLRPRDVTSERMYDTPIVAWANFKLPPRAIPEKANLLMPFILEAAGIKPEGYAKFIDGVTRYAPRSFGETAATSCDFQMMQYDLLFGKQFVLAMDNTAQSGSGMAAAIESGRHADKGHSIVIQDYGPEEGVLGVAFNPQPDGASAFWFKTANVTEQTVVMLDGIELPTIIGKNGTSLTATLPRDTLAKAGTYHLTLFDKTSKLRSNEVPFTLKASTTPVTPKASATATATPVTQEVPPPLEHWGPQMTETETDFNFQSDEGCSALWFVLERPVQTVTVLLNGKPLTTTLGADHRTVTALVPKALYAKPGNWALQIRDEPTGKLSPPVTFKVLPKARAGGK